jgi:alpha-glucosidase
MDRTGWEALAVGRPERRPFVLSRSGWAGLQRWAWNWTADIESSWGALRQQVATTIGLGLSGVPYTGSDIGGFNGVPSPELVTRWLELSVLMPFCRTHSVIGSPSREPWRFPEPYRSAIGRLIGFRYRILPYLYTLAYEASRSGIPLVRPLCWPAPDGGGGGGSSADPRMWRVDDAYLLGDSILVAPVTEEGGQSRTVPLPAGRWYRWRALPEMAQTGEMAKTGDPLPAGGDQVTVVEGGRTVQLDAPVGQPLMLVREGTELPIEDVSANSRS